MIDVVCFCGCSYSFPGDTGTCPDCGETVTFRRPWAGESHETTDEREPLSPAAGERAPHELAA